MKLEYNGKVSEKGLHIVNRKDFDQNMFLHFLGQDVVITVEKKRVKRSSPQNRYFHSLITILTKELNTLGNDFTTEDVKNLVKMKFAKEAVSTEDGEYIGDRLKHTAQMSKEEMSYLIEKMKAWAAEFNIYLPDAGVQQFIQY